MQGAPLENIVPLDSRAARDQAYSVNFFMNILRRSGFLSENVEDAGLQKETPDRK